MRSWRMASGRNSYCSWLAVLPVVPPLLHALLGLGRYQAVIPSLVKEAEPVLYKEMTKGRKARQPSCGMFWT